MTASRIEGPVVAVGGGRGLATSLRAIRRLTDDVVAVVSVADDGGSSGRLRGEFGGVAVGDLRKCLLALAPQSPFADALEYRFDRGDVAGHTVGNLLLAGLMQSVGPLAAADEVARVLGGVGRVIPATPESVVLVGRTRRGAVVRGQSSLVATPDIDDVWLEPLAAATPDAVSAIERARMVVLGPGSLFTSVLAALAVPGIRSGVSAAPTVVYVANLSPQEAETRGFSADQEVAALRRHGIEPHVVVRGDGLAGSGDRHDPDRLAEALVAAVAERL